MNFKPIKVDQKKFFEKSVKSPEKKKADDSSLGKVKYRNIRGFQMSRAKRQNWKLFCASREYIDGHGLDEKQVDYLESFRKNINQCCNHSLFREHLSNNSMEFLGAMTCKHKLCHVCNARRAKEVRRKYRLLFERNPDLIEKYDFMHLTLTVPHNENGYRGKRWYASELLRHFNFMRKKKWWTENVFAGELGIEVTKRSQGLHIHIHSMILVQKFLQNRNYLAKEILLYWNRATAGASDRKSFQEEEIESLLRGYRNISILELKQLNPSGATNIGLESLYVSSNKRRKGYLFSERTQSYKKYVNAKAGFDDFIAGIMECIKYHFEPLAMEKNGNIDFDLLLEILPAIKGKPLYQKFGAFRSGTKNALKDASILNLNFNEWDTIDEIIKETAKNEIVNPITGVAAEREEFRYLVMPLPKVFFNEAQEFLPEVKEEIKSSRGIYLDDAWSLKDALLGMTEAHIRRVMSDKVAGNYVNK